MTRAIDPEDAAPDVLTNRLGPLKEAARTLPDSTLRFDDGGQFRIEIPSTEGPAAFEAVLDAAQQHGVPIHRVSQGSGITLLRDDELRRYAELGARHGVEVCLFVGPRAPWDADASALVPDGKFFGWRHLTLGALQAAYDDVLRAVAAGIRSILVADEGLITLIGEAKRTGELPRDLVVKASAILGIANPLGAALLTQHGVDSVNIPGDTGLPELAAFRAALTAVLDLYIEGPDGLGGFLRYHDLGEIVRIAAPTYLKFGLRNAPNLYPSGMHLEATAIATARERVRRAAIGIEHLNRHGRYAISPHGQPRPGIPVRTPTPDAGQMG